MRAGIKISGGSELQYVAVNNLFMPRRKNHLGRYEEVGKPEPCPLEAERSLLPETESANVSAGPLGQRLISTLNAKEKKIFLTRNSRTGLGWAGLARHSHPIASTDGTVGVRSVNARGATLNHLAARAGNGVGLSRLASRGRGSATGTSLVIVISTGLLTCGLGNSLGVLLVLVDGPVEDVVVLEALADKEVSEDLAEVAVVGLVVEAEGSSVVEVDGKLVGEATAENLGRGRHLLLHDAVILLLLSRSLQTLPGQRATAEVEHDVAKRLHVITAGLLCFLLALQSRQERSQWVNVPTPR